MMACFSCFVSLSCVFDVGARGTPTPSYGAVVFVCVGGGCCLFLLHRNSKEALSHFLHSALFLKLENSNNKNSHNFASRGLKKSNKTER